MNRDWPWHELGTHHQDSLEQDTKGIGNCANAVAPEVSSWSSKISSRLNGERHRDPLKSNPYILKMDATRDIKLYISSLISKNFSRIFFDSVIEILFLLPSLCTQLAPSGISSTFFVHTAGSIWWTGSVEEKLNLDSYDLIF